jgi:nucleobase:cation symporter-1, NCS1 family
VGLLIGNIAGGCVMALHSAQGPRLGLPQMISSRAQFGVYGAVVPLVLVILLYLGFAATGTVLAGQAINQIFSVDAPALGIILFGLLTAFVATLGYRYIHIMGRVSTVVGIIGFTYLAIRLFIQYDVGSLLGVKPFEMPTFLLAISLGAGWQLTYGPYVADYSRYLPRSTPERTTFLSTLAGSVLGSQWSMTFGALVAAIPVTAGVAFLDEQVGFLGQLGGGGVIALVIYLVIVVGKLTVNCLNAYGGFMSIVTTVTAFTRSVRISRVARAAFIAAFVLVSVLIALLATEHFLSNFRNFILALLMVFTPWSAVNLVDYYLISKERVDIPAMYDPDGRYGRWNVVALVSYAIGIVVQIPFMAQALYTGPLTEKLGGADISWLVGLVVTAAIYYPWAKRTANPPTEMIYPAEVVEEEAR